MLESKLPNLVEPVINSLDEVISCTTRVCAVIVPVIRALEAVISLLTSNDPVI